VSAAGNDGHRGTTPRQAWRSIGRVNRAQLKPGDRVLFRGGDSFDDATLTPNASGTSRERVVFGSYGGTRARLHHPGAAVWFAGRSYVTFRDLDLSNDMSDGAVVAGSPSGGSSFITIRGCLIHDTTAVGILSPTDADASWRIVGNQIVHTGDSGLIILGSNVLISGNKILNTGWNDGIGWDKHGIYMKGPGATIRRNLISGFQANGVSLRSKDALVDGNVIQGGQFGIAYFDFTRSSGTSKVVNNHVSNVRTAFYFSRDPAYYGEGNPIENFDIIGNVFEVTGAAAMDITGARYSRVTVERNVLKGPFDVALAIYSPAEGGQYLERRNTIFGRGLFAWNGSSLAYSGYRAASGQGAGDQIRGTP
jgi:hypothetical protein